MSAQYIRIQDDGDSEPMEIPTEDDGTIFLSSINAQFPGCCGLKYRNPDTNSLRGVKLVEGILYPPDQEHFWNNYLYLTVYPKDNKRKMEDEDTQSVRSKRPAQKCTDLIVLGLPWKVEEKDLETYFKQYGDLVMTLVKRDGGGKSKGYGFIRYANYEAQEAVIRKPHVIEGRRCEVKIPHSKDEPQMSSKVFVGRITESTTKDDLKNYFEQFGDVDDIYIPAPFRSFAFVTFRDSAIAQKLIGENHVINGVSVCINNAEPKGSKEPVRQNTMSGGMPFQYGGFSGRGNMPSDQGRYFGGSGNNQGSGFGDQRGGGGGRSNFDSGNTNFNPMNPAVLAAALDSWQTVMSGMFGAARGNNWQGGGDMKKGGGGWSNKGDNKWS